MVMSLCGKHLRFSSSHSFHGVLFMFQTMFSFEFIVALIKKWPSEKGVKFSYKSQDAIMINAAAVGRLFNLKGSENGAFLG